MWVVTLHSLSFPYRDLLFFHSVAIKTKQQPLTGSDGNWEQWGQGWPAACHLAGSVSPWTGVSAPLLLSGLLALGRERPMVGPW